MADAFRADDLRKLVKALRELYSSATGNFAERAIRSIDLLLPGDMTVFTALDPSRGLIQLVPSSGEHELESLHKAFLRFEHQHPSIEHGRAGGEHGVDIVSDLCSATEWHRRDLYQEVFRRLGLEDQLVVSAPMEVPKALGVTVSRSRRGFSSRERALMELYAPHFADAYHIHESLEQARSLEMAAQDATLTAGMGILQVSTDGHVMTQNAFVRDALEHYFGSPHDRAPAQLLTALRRIESEDPSSTGAPRRYSLAKGGKSLHIELAPEPTFSHWTVILREQLPPAPKPTHEALAARLPPRLQRTLDLLLTELSEKQIAAELKLSKATVHEYVTLVYRHFDVRSRSGLMALWVQR